MNNFNVRLISFYLPQYHPIPENDRWWSKGFTEWTNVTKAKPLFRGHYQPHLPADLGFYDLRLPEVRQAQADLARQYGIDGFCYYHYWFNGRRLLERPFNEVLNSGKPDFPFCLCWANESWSRRWLGEEKAILMKQTYSIEDDYNHIRWLIQAFSDHRYIRVNKKPLLLIYRPLNIPNPQKTTDIFREECVKNGLSEPYLLGVDAHCPGYDCREVGFDATLVFEPQLGLLPGFMNENINFYNLINNIKFKIPSPRIKVYDYAAARRLMLNLKRSFPFYPSIFVRWDNTPRRGKNGVIVINSEPEVFGKGLSEMILSINNNSLEDIVFINAWNEWAEGNYLEPDIKYGHTYLEAVKQAKSNIEKLEN